MQLADVSSSHAGSQLRSRRYQGSMRTLDAEEPTRPVHCARRGSMNRQVTTLK
jgi:hypothetical protein